MVLIYCRVSTKRQAQEGYSYEQQERDGIDFASNLNQDYLIYKDTISGKTANRVEWQKFLKKISESNSNDYVFFMVNDRLGRNLIEFENFKNACTKVKINVYDNYKKRYMRYEEEGDDLISTIEGKLSEQERKKILLRTYKGLQSSWSEGKRIHSKIYGYDSSTFDSNTGKRIWIIVEDEADNIRRAYELFHLGLSLHGISKKINDEGRRKRKNQPFSYDDIRKILSKSIYAGLTVDSNGNLINSKLYEPIVSVDEFNYVKSNWIKKVTENKRGRNPLHLGSGMLRCKNCNSGFWVYKAQGRLYYRHNADINCGNQKLYQYSAINLILEKAYVDAIVDKPTIIEMNNPIDYTDDIMRFEKLIIKKNKEIENYNQAIATGNAIDFFAGKIGIAVSELDNLKKEKDLIEVKYRKEIEKRKKLLSDFAIENIEEFYNLEGEKKRQKLQSVVDRAIVTSQDIEVVLQDGRILHYDYQEWLSAAKQFEKKLKEKLNINSMEETKKRVKKANKKIKEEIEKNMKK